MRKSRDSQSDEILHCKRHAGTDKARERFVKRAASGAGGHAGEQPAAAVAGMRRWLDEIFGRVVGGSAPGGDAK
jgi:hypothetical protein